MIHVLWWFFITSFNDSLCLSTAFRWKQFDFQYLFSYSLSLVWLCSWRLARQYSHCCIHQSVKWSSCSLFNVLSTITLQSLVIHFSCQFRINWLWHTFLDDAVTWDTRTKPLFFVCPPHFLSIVFLSCCMYLSALRDLILRNKILFSRWTVRYYTFIYRKKLKEIF